MRDDQLRAESDRLPDDFVRHVERKQDLINARCAVTEKKAGIVISILSIIAVVISVAALIICLKPAETDAKKTDVQYVLYLGTNDKDSNLPVFTPDEAKKKAEDILIDHFGGYTIQEASGGWVDGDTEYQEYTLVIYLSDTDLESVHSAADEMIVEFHQSSVLIQANQTITEFYSGSN